MSQVAHETTVCIAGTAASLVHITCCADDDLGLCGDRLTGVFEPDDYTGHDRCVVCADLNRFDCCPVFGALR